MNQVILTINRIFSIHTSGYSTIKLRKKQVLENVRKDKNY